MQQAIIGDRWRQLQQIQPHSFIPNAIFLHTSLASSVMLRTKPLEGQRSKNMKVQTHFNLSEIRRMIAPIKP